MEKDILGVRCGCDKSLISLVVFGIQPEPVEVVLSSGSLSWLSLVRTSLRIRAMKAQCCYCGSRKMLVVEAMIVKLAPSPSFSQPFSPFASSLPIFLSKSLISKRERWAAQPILSLFCSPTGLISNTPLLIHWFPVSCWAWFPSVFSTQSLSCSSKAKLSLVFTFSEQPCVTLRARPLLLFSQSKMYYPLLLQGTKPL